jgi:hypothetical protein
MTLTTSHGLFLINQEFQTISAAQPHVHARVLCFNFGKKDTFQFERAVSGAFPQSWSETEPSTPACASVQHASALVAALSSAFPDWDFSTVCPWDFRLVASPEEAQQRINWAFQTEVTDCERILSHMWAALEKEINLVTCNIYSYEPDRPDAFSESGAVLNLCYFFLSEKLNKIVLVHLREGGHDFNSGSDDDELEDVYQFSVF